MTRPEIDSNQADGDVTSLSGRSYLLVDHGHSQCTVTLYDLVEGRYRMIGCGEGLNTAGPPWYDITHGLLQAIGQISDATGRKLMSLQGQLIRPTRADGSGVDYFGATVSLGDPLRVIVAGLLEHASIASARKAVRASYAHELACFHPNDGRGRAGQIEELLTSNPDVVLLVGGTDGGADEQVLELMTTLAIGLELLDESRRPIVFYGGNAVLRAQIVAGLSELTEVRLLDNVQPSFEQEQIEHAIALLADAYYSLKVEAVGSGGVLADWCNTSPMSSAHAFGAIAEYFAAAGNGRVAGVDVGSEQVTVISAVPGQVDLVTRTDLGLGRKLGSFFQKGSILNQPGLVIEGASGRTTADYVLDKSIHPHAIPLSDEAAALEMAVASRLIRQTVSAANSDWSWSDLGDGPEFDTLLLRGRVFTAAGSKREALLSLIDGLRARGVYKVLSDAHGLFPAMGLLAGDDPEIVVQVMSGPDLERLGWVIAPAGRGRQGQTILKVAVQSKSLNEISIELPWGHLEVVPLPTGETATLRLEPSSGFDIGAGPGKQRQLTVSGGTIGLLLDGRGRSDERRGGI